MAERAKRVSFGDILIISLPTHAPHGHEQEGKRPAIVVGILERAGTPRYPAVLVAPLTTQEGSWARNAPLLYPRLQAGAGGLPRPSLVLLDQLRSLDAQRVSGYLGSLTHAEFEPIRAGILRIFDLTNR